jgi:glycosyltransferase involved in cell wall biosynthesis
MMKHVGMRARIVTTVAQSSIPRLTRLGISRKNIRYIPNGVDHGIFRPISTERVALRTRLGVGTDQVLILSLGQLRAAKGVSVLLDSIGQVLGNCDNVLFVIAGRGPMAREVEERVTGQKWTGRVRLILRHIEGYETPAFFNASDIFVLPSHWEGQPLALLEAMACGSLPVASNVGDVPYIIKDGVNGSLVQPGNSFELANKLVQLVGNHDLREQMRRESPRVVEVHNWDIITEQYQKLYAELTA